MKYDDINKLSLAMNCMITGTRKFVVEKASLDGGEDCPGESYSNL